MPPEWRGSRLAAILDFPLLVKFIFPTGKLSIQVHPNDAYASQHEKALGGRGKTEMWHAVLAQPGAEVLAGLKPGARKENFLRAMSDHTIEELFVHWKVRAGDTFFVPAGTPHTIGPGMILCEVQQYSDLTYRMYDYGRVDAHGKPRELHVDKALDVTDFGRSPSEYGRTTSVEFSGEGYKKCLVAACSYFAAETWENFGRLDISSDCGQFEIFVMLNGKGSVAWGSESAKYDLGQCWLIPANLGKFSLSSEAPTKLLRVYVPDLAQLRASLERRGHSAQSLSQTIFK